MEISILGSDPLSPAFQQSVDFENVPNRHNKLFKFFWLDTMLAKLVTMYPLALGNIKRDKMSKLHSKFRIQFYNLIIKLTIISAATVFDVTTK